MKKRISILAVALLLVCAFGLTACGKNNPAPKTYDVSKLYSAGGLQLSKYVKEMKEADGGILVKTEVTIVSGTKMTLDVTFKAGKFDNVEMTLSGADKDKYTDALTVDNETYIKSNDPTAVKGLNIRLPRSERSGENNKVENPFDFDTGDANDHQIVGTAAFECLEYAVAAFRFVAAAENVFGSYDDYVAATDKTVEAWDFEGTLATASAGSAEVRIEKVLQTADSYVVFAASGAPSQHAQAITAMVRIDKATHKVLKADYAYFHVSEYRSEADVEKYIASLTAAKAAVEGVDVRTKTYAGKTGDPAVYQLGGVANATLTNSVLVNAFNAAFDYYNARLLG